MGAYAQRWLMWPNAVMHVTICVARACCTRMGSCHLTARFRFRRSIWRGCPQVLRACYRYIAVVFLRVRRVQRGSFVWGNLHWRGIGRVSRRAWGVRVWSFMRGPWTAMLKRLQLGSGRGIVMFVSELLRHWHFRCFCGSHL